MFINIFGKAISITVESITSKRQDNQDSAGWIVLTKSGIKGEITNKHIIDSDFASDDEILFCIVCDGMGGLENGQVVSSTVVNSSIDWVQNTVFQSTNDVIAKYEAFLKDIESEIMSSILIPEQQSSCVLPLMMNGTLCILVIPDVTHFPKVW